MLSFSGYTFVLLHVSLYPPVGQTDLYIVVSNPHFKRTKEDISRHLGDWVVELTCCHLYIILIKANLRLKNEEIDLLLIGTAKYCGHVLQYTIIMLRKPKLDTIKRDSREAKLEFSLYGGENFIKESRGGHSMVGRGWRT